MSETIVIKFGGTSVGTPERIAAVAKRVVGYQRRTGSRVVVVVSAMSGETDRLVALGRQIAGEEFPNREYHQLLASGEQVSAALTAMAIEREGARAQSVLAHQLPLRTKSVYGLNLIDSIEREKLQGLLAEGVIPVVAGFQGVDEEGALTTLGRGGSDTTAVAIAAVLDRCLCLILTDVDGVYTARPQICPEAKKLDAVSYEEMLELAGSGAKVLQTRSVSLAKKFKVPLEVGLSFEERPGTKIVEEYAGMEHSIVSGITYSTTHAKITLKGLPHAPGVAAKLFGVMADAGIVVDEIVQAFGENGKTSIAFTVPLDSLAGCERVLQAHIQESLPEAQLEVDKEIVKLSIVGEGMRTHSGVAQQMFEVLGSEGINIDMITTSEIKISVVVHSRYAELAVRSLHKKFIEQ